MCTQLFSQWFMLYAPWVYTTCASSHRRMWMNLYMTTWILMWVQWIRWWTLDLLTVTQWIDIGILSLLIFIYSVGPLGFHFSWSLSFYYFLFLSVQLVLYFQHLSLSSRTTIVMTNVVLMSWWSVDVGSFVASMIRYDQLRKPYRTEQRQQQQIQNCVSSFL